MINTCQHGFLPGHSCMTQVIELYHKLSQGYENNLEPRIVFLDIKKAFGLVYKLKKKWYLWKSAKLVY